MKTARLLLVFLLMTFVVLPGFAEGDTGKYQISDYKVKLTPHSDGKVDIEYYQKWLVTDGHIPWITVGLPNNDYTIVKSGMAVKKIVSANESGWSGVRIDLDRDYKPKESFEVSFTVNQTKLFYADDKNYKLDFTPGWYDRAFTDNMEIRLKCFAKPESIKADPKPTKVSGQEMIWSRNKLGKGEKVSISISFPKNVMAKEIPDANLKKGMSGWVIFLIIIGVIVLIIIIIIVLEESGGYGGGGIFYGGGGSSGRSSGGGGGFGGRSSSCACACVSCVCACACAGGGGAGCSRKTKHSCPLCRGRRKEDEKKE